MVKRPYRDGNFARATIRGAYRNPAAAPLRSPLGLSLVAIKKSAIIAGLRLYTLRSLGYLISSIPVAVMGFLSSKELLLTLFLKMGLAGSLAALLARSATFRKVLYTEERDSDEKVRLMLFFTPPLAVGVMLRLLGYPFADLMLEGAFVLGLLGGRVPGLLGGAIISLPAFFNHEWLSTPMGTLAGLLGGMIRQSMPNTEAVWNLGPFTFLAVPRYLWRWARGRERERHWEMLALAACCALELGQLALGSALHGRWLFFFASDKRWAPLPQMFASMMAVAIPIKIWNTIRVEANLEEHQQMLLKARMDALSNQINPHFLFNTLNTVSALVRTDPDMARVVVLKLSSILRRLLRQQENFVPLREELTFTDDYLDIEVARSGRDKLEIVKEIDEASLDVFIPSMLLQPIVENSIRHGLAPKLEGGIIHIRTALDDGRLRIEIEDNGMGITEARLARVHEEGIGMSNVQARLKLLYGDDFRFEISSQFGTGTRVRIEVPELVSVLPAAS
jgi:two-component system LytT family sensor kinase